MRSITLMATQAMMRGTISNRYASHVIHESPCESITDSVEHRRPRGAQSLTDRVLTSAYGLGVQLVNVAKVALRRELLTCMRKKPTALKTIDGTLRKDR